MKRVIASLVVFLMISTVIYTLCSLIMWDINIGVWPWYMRGIFVVCELVLLGKIIDENK